MSKKKMTRVVKLKETTFPEISETPVNKEKLNLKSYLTPKNVILVIVFIAFILFWKFKGQFIVALVNGQPISRWQLNSQMEKRFGEQVLDNIINERLIMSAIRQKGVFINSTEIDAKTKEIEDKLNGKMTLDDALKAQGMTKEDFKSQIEVQLSIDKIFDKEATLSAVEVDDYIKNNGETFKNSTEPAKVKEEVYAYLKQQKIAEMFDKWFTDIKKNADIKKFLQ